MPFNVRTVRYNKNCLFYFKLDRALHAAKAALRLSIPVELTDQFDQFRRLGAGSADDVKT